MIASRKCEISQLVVTNYTIGLAFRNGGLFPWFVNTRAYPIRVGSGVFLLCIANLGEGVMLVA
jgi:hypothetical protein